MRVLLIVPMVVMMIVPMALGDAEPAGAPDAAALLARGRIAVDDVHLRVMSLITSSPHPLFTEHLRSTDALVQADWTRASLDPEADLRYLKRSVGFVEKIREGLNGAAGEWDSYAAGRRSLMFAFVSRYDKTLQLYSLRLPRGWDPEKAYPMIVYLHGYVSNPHPLWFTSLSFGPGAKNPPSKAKAEELEPHFSLGPWGRGNTQYRYAGETDVWEALKDAESQFKIDADRIYLTGHSMGGYGTWSIGVRSPDRWAGLGIFSGGDSYAPARSGLAANAALMPVMIWHGQKDNTVPVERAYGMRDALGKVGNTAKVIIDEDAGHSVPRGASLPVKRWLLQHRRVRPDRFSYLADSQTHRGAWGVVMRRDPFKTPNPRFDCRVDGAAVHIDSEGTDGLDIQLGAGGLGLSGNVTVIWNGEKAYEGPAEKIKLGIGSHRRGW